MQDYWWVAHLGDVYGKSTLLQSPWPQHYMFSDASHMVKDLSRRSSTVSRPLETTILTPCIAIAAPDRCFFKFPSGAPGSQPIITPWGNAWYNDVVNTVFDLRRSKSYELGFSSVKFQLHHSNTWLNVDTPSESDGTTWFCWDFKIAVWWDLTRWNLKILTNADPSVFQWFCYGARRRSTRAWLPAPTLFFG